MNLQNFVSSKVTEDLLSRTLASLQSVTQNASTENVESIIQAAVEQLGSFNYSAGVELSTVVARITEIAQSMETSESDYDQLYAAAFEKDAQFASTTINDLSGRMATALASLVRELRNDLPPKVEELCSAIREKAEASWEDLDVRKITPANRFDWGRLSEITYLNQVTETATELTKTFMKTPVPYDAVRILRVLDSQMYNSTVVIPNQAAAKDFILANLPESELPLAMTVDILTSGNKARDVVGYAKAVMDPELGTGRYSIVALTQKVSDQTKALEALDVHFASLDAGEFGDQIKTIASRIPNMLTVCSLILAAVQVHRVTTYKNTLIIPTGPGRKATMPPKGDSMYANGDTLSMYVEMVKSDLGMEISEEEALADVTTLGHYNYLVEGNFGVNGLLVSRAVGVREKAINKVEESNKAATDAEMIARNRATIYAMNTILAPVKNARIKELPAMEQHFNRLSELRLQRAQVDLHHGFLALEDQVTMYLLDLEMKPALTSLQTSVSSAMRSWSEKVSDANQIRDAAFCEGLSNTIVDFLEAGGHVTVQ